LKPHLLFTLEEPRVLVLAVLCTTITIYLITLGGKSRDLRILIATFSCWTSHFLIAALRESVYPLPEWLAILQMGAGLAGLVLFIGFAYSFRGHPYPRELRSVLALASVSVLACCSFLAFQSSAGKALSWPVASGLSVGLFVWAEGVFVRRWIRSKHPREARPFRSFALAFLLSVSAVGVYFLRDLGAVTAELASVISSILYLANLVAFALAYVNNAPRPTTFRIKIVGASLFAVLAIVTLMWTFVAPSWDDSGAISAHDTGSKKHAGRAISDEEFVRQALSGNGLKFQRTVIPVTTRFSDRLCSL